ncbi:hypothetical protein ACKKBG_A15175 [Auxenochlorella protothecoides x Auxenochlorella symbiontica]
MQLGPHIPTVAACLAGLGWVFWLIERNKSKEFDGSRSPKPSAPPLLPAREGGEGDLADEVEPPSAQGCWTSPPSKRWTLPTQGAGSPDSGFRPESYIRRLDFLRRQQSMLAESAAQGEGMDDLGVGLQKHESQLLTLAQQLTLLRMEVEEAMDEEEPGTPSEAPSPQGSEDIRAGSGPSPARSGRPSLAPQFQTRAHGPPPPDEDAHGPDHDREERGFGSSPAAGAARARSTASSSGSCGGAGAAPSAPVSPSPAGAWRGAPDLLAQDAELADVESWLMGAGPGSPDPGAASDPGRLARAAAEFAATWMPLSPAQHRGKAAGAAPASRRLELDRLAVPGKGGVHQGRGLGPVTPQQAQREVAARPASPGPSPASPGLRIAAHRPQGLRLAPTIASPIARREPRPAGLAPASSSGSNPVSTKIPRSFPPAGKKAGDSTSFPAVAPKTRIPRPGR